MNGREIVKETINFSKPERLAMSLADGYQQDIGIVCMSPDTDARPSNQYDEWGAYWENIGTSRLGEVKEFPLKTWDMLDTMKIPDINLPERWETIPEQMKPFEGRYIIAYGQSLYERCHYLRGLEELWMDLYLHPDELDRLLEILVDINIAAVGRYASFGVDGYFIGDDWGLQNSLMISPDSWRRFLKPRYERIFSECHKHGMHAILHSCGYIVDILDDFIEIGLDVIQMDQQENMGLELLGSRFGGRITFWSPVDIQTVMYRGNTEEIRTYCRKMATVLPSKEGGFIAGYYIDPVGAGHSPAAVEAMCEEFMKIGRLR